MKITIIAGLHPAQTHLPYPQRKEKVDLFLSRQDTDFVMKIFNKYADKKDTFLSVNGLQRALFELGVPYRATIASELEKRGDWTFQEFQTFLMEQPTNLDKWISTLPLPGLLSECLDIHDGDELRQLSRLSEERIADAVKIFSYGLRRVLTDGQAKLKQIFTLMDESAQQIADGSAPKFLTFKMNTGTVSDYFEGLSGRIGELSSESFINWPHY